MLLEKSSGNSRALNPPITADRGDPSLNEAAERILGFADLVRRHPEAKAVFTGGSGRLLGQEYKEDVTARAAVAGREIARQRLREQKAAAKAVAA